MKTSEMVAQRSKGAFILTAEQAAALFTPAEIESGEARGKLDTYGPWQLPVRFIAICTAQSFAGDAYHEKHSHPLYIYGKRTLTRPRESGYALEGQVSVNGKKVRAFTSSALFELPNGKLISAATIHACLDL